MNDDEEIYSDRNEAIDAAVRELKNSISSGRHSEVTAAVCQGRPNCLLTGNAAYLWQQVGCQQCVQIVVDAAMHVTISDPMKATN